MTAEQWIEWARRKSEAVNGRPEDKGQQRQDAAPAGQHPALPGPHERAASPGQHAAPPGPHATPFAERREDPYAIRQGNREQRPGRHDGHDESDPRRPSDPPWRGRTARRTSTPEAMRALRGARLRQGWTLTRAAEETGVSRPHLSLLERGLRRPSESVAEAIAIGYRMTPGEADALAEIAVPWAGRDSPYRTGVEPGDR